MKMVGSHLTMSMASNRTAELWKSFMTRRKEIHEVIGEEFYSIQFYKPGFFEPFIVTATFAKWACAAVTDFKMVPHGMETMILPGGLYAVFHHQGAATTGPKTFGYIFGQWLPNSDYMLDDRPHFEVLGKKYRNDDLASEEEICIPIKPRQL